MEYNYSHDTYANLCMRELIICKWNANVTTEWAKQYKQYRTNEINTNIRNSLWIIIHILNGIITPNCKKFIASLRGEYLLVYCIQSTHSQINIWRTCQDARTHVLLIGMQWLNYKRSGRRQSALLTISSVLMGSPFHYEVDVIPQICMFAHYPEVGQFNREISFTFHCIDHASVSETSTPALLLNNCGVVFILLT